MRADRAAPKTEEELGERAARQSAMPCFMKTRNPILKDWFGNVSCRERSFKRCFISPATNKGLAQALHILPEHRVQPGVRSDGHAETSAQAD